MNDWNLLKEEPTHKLTQRFLLQIVNETRAFQIEKRKENKGK